MGRFVEQADITVEARVVLRESELRALDALTGYGVDEFIRVFYAEMGEAYLKPHEAGLRSLFAAIRSEVPGILGNAESARRVAKGEEPRRV